MKLQSNVAGAGSNGPTAAVRLATHGWRVEVRERAGEAGGAVATRTLDDDTLSDLGADGVAWEWLH
ncbi:NAD(P)-binding protein [Corynebacterium coyleae]|uniref:NAD(P)-binding protein n=1 Tax=Corynebacterium coyleae TaxID=53374 RepID=UPI00254D28E8|nr:NAD(P)-binding protein [Corynebacterium coyleae]MDK8799843.1 NAD(P)-binding protein [Corynebacterium coyleae]